MFACTAILPFGIRRDALLSKENMIRPILILAVLPLAIGVSKAQTPARNTPEEIKLLVEKSKPDTQRIRLLLDWSRACIMKPGEDSRDLDEAIEHANQALQLSQWLGDKQWEGNCYVVFSMAWREKGDRQQGRSHALQAIQMLSKSVRQEDLGAAHVELANYYDAFSEHENPERIRLYEMAEQFFERSGAKRRQADALKDLGDLYQIKGDFVKSLERLEKALTLYQSIHFPDLQGVYDLMGTVAQQTGNYHQALKYGLLALKTAEAIKDTTAQLCTIFNRVGVIYHQLGQYEQAKECFNKSLSIAMKFRDTTAVHVLIPNIVNTHLRLKRPADALVFLKDIDQKYPSRHISDRVMSTSSFLNIYLSMDQITHARPYFQRLLAMHGQNLSTSARKTMGRSLIRHMLATGQYQRVYRYIAEYEELNKKSVSLTGLSDAYYWRFKADSSLGKYPEAIRHFQMHKLMRDSMFNEASHKQIAQLEIQYETEKKDRDLLLKEQSIQLLTEQGRLQESKLQQANLVKNVTFSGIILLLVIIGLLYNRNRLKQKNAREQEAKQQEINEKNQTLQHLLEEKEWLMREIHHRVKNNLQIAISLLNTQISYLDNNSATEAIRDSQHRMRAMSLIHQKLYQSEKLTYINMYSYIRELLDYLDDNFNASRHIQFELQVAPVDLDVTQAVPVGLILNEAITNAIKYAFPNNIKGMLVIFMDYTGDGQLLLRIHDNGKGLPADFDVAQIDSFGLNLMQGLAKQLNGTFAIKSDKGVTVSIEFPDEKTSAPVALNRKNANQAV